MSSKDVMARVAELGPRVNAFLCDKIREYQPDLTNQSVDQAVEQDVAVSIMVLQTLLAAQQSTAESMGIDYKNALK